MRGGALSGNGVRVWERAEAARGWWWGWDEGRMNPTSTIDAVDVEFKLRSHAN